MRLIIFTTSLNDTAFQEFFNLACDLQYEVVGIAVLEENIVGTTFKDVPVFYLPNINEDMTDILLLPYIDWEYKNNSNAILTMLKDFFHFPKEKVVSGGFLIKEFFRLKYEYTLDPEIQNILKYLENHDISPFNQYLADTPDTFDDAFYDENADLHYIFFETAAGKKLKMYFPNTYFPKLNSPNEKYQITNVLKEQVPTSPHLYTTETHKVNDGDIIVDVGVCEGNFALRYADIASKIYLFEMDESWFKPLYYTFNPLDIEVEMIQKGASDITNEQFAKIDDAVDLNGKSYFLKMDVEGAETAALRGADKLLKTGRVTSSICTYHRPHDDVKIKALLRKYGYKTEFSKGYMFFWENQNFWDMMNFRHGVIYGDR